MKKVLFALAASSLLAVSCDGLLGELGWGENGNGQGGQEKKEAVLPEPATVNEAINIQFDQGETLKLELPERAKPNDPIAIIPEAPPATVDIRAIEFTESSRYILRMGETETKVLNAGIKEKVWTGRYEFHEGVYQMEGIGELRVRKEENICLIRVNRTPTKADGDQFPEISTKASIAAIPNPGTQIERNLARNWKVKSTYIKVSSTNNGISGARGFDGCDMHEIASYLKSKNANISDADLEKLEGYKITEIIFNGLKEIVINFDGPEAFTGYWDLNTNEFSWTLLDTNDFIPANTTGKATFPEGGPYLLTINTEVKGDGDVYAGTIEFTLEESK